MSYGIHVHKDTAPSLGDQVAKVAKLWTTMQLYTHGPRSYNKNPICDEKIINATKDMSIYVHSTHFSKPWKGNVRGIIHIQDQLKTAYSLGAQGLVVHLPKDLPSVVVEYMPQLYHPHVMTILEMTSVKPDDHKTYETPAKINRLIDALEAASITNYGLCIDTSHIWAAGQNVSTKSFMDEWFDQIEDKSKIVMIHLNGSSIDLGGGKDTHIIPFTKEDKIWGGDKPTMYRLSGVKSCVEFSKTHNIPLILEINRGEEKDIEHMRQRLVHAYE